MIEQGYEMKVDKRGRRNIGFAYINRNGLNPKKNHVVRETDATIAFRLSKTDKDLLGRISASHGISISELLRIYTTWGIEQEG